MQFLFQNLYIRRHLYIYSSSPEDDSKIERILRAADVIDVSETCVAYGMQHNSLQKHQLNYS